jgi:predicted DNA-binding transcriptional regulator YafY
MKKKVKNAKKVVSRRERFFDMLCEMLGSSNPVKLKDTAARFEVSVRTIQKDLVVLVELLNDPSGREYIIHDKGRGEYRGNFPRATVNLTNEATIYLFLALQQIRPILSGDGNIAYNRLMNEVNQLLSEKDRNKFDVWSRCYHVREHGFPIKRENYYPFLHTFLEAILHNYIVKMSGDRGIRYFDPFLIYHARESFYVIGDTLDSLQYQAKRNRKRRQYRLDRLSKVELLKKNKSELYKYPKNAWGYKRVEAEKYLEGMFGAESSGKPQDYVLEIRDQKVFERMVEKQWHPKQRFGTPVETMEGFSCELVIPQTRSPFEMKKFVLSWGSALIVKKPEHFRLEIAAELKKMSDLYK